MMKHRKAKPLIFLAGAYKGNRSANTVIQIDLHKKIMLDGVVLPYSPLIVGHTIIKFHDIGEPVWESFDREVLDHCQALLRYNKYDKSKGAKVEERYMRSLGRPVFYNIPSLYKWAKEQ